ncbi:amino acid ABC transporter ATP-binding protein [Roseomonas sp. OT10]|uniref:amino acid ABC transporter ATP-binding protein n=1 Tax=Roseomonas cutis TaxID=2897332 RepID=UPI001E46E6E9|nr:amino acid ABC transporter ATP-binding protein [Roseomonas sp. OT10]UFN48518.1 amino acid ABC transporter ATP-binding protein [Roseomonas sp. OT10]
MPAPLLRLRGLRRVLGGQPVLRGIDLDLPDGQVLAILGPSGGGKSTLLRCMNLLDRPDDGSVAFEGQELTRLSGPQLRRARSRIGMVFQLFHLFPHLTARQNVAMAPTLTQGMGREEAEQQAEATLARVGLAHKADAYPRHLSGGQQQRVAIARAMAMRPRLMLFDEPTSALDVEMVSEVLQVMRDLVADGMTMVVVSHELGFVRSAADRVIFLAGGEIVEDRPARGFLDDPREARSRQFLSAVLRH